MKRKIVSGAINDVGVYITKQNELFKVTKQELVNNINKINEAYKGVDASIIIDKYLKRAKNLDTIIKNFEYYGVYLQKIAGYYQENFDNSMKQMKEVENKNTAVGSEETIMDLGTFELDKIVSN